MNVEEMAIRVYPYIIEWLKKVDKSKILSGKPEPIEKVEVLPEWEFTYYDAITILHKELKYSKSFQRAFDRFYFSYGYGIYISDEWIRKDIRRVVVHELIHLAGIYEHSVKLNGFWYVNAGKENGVEKYLVEKFKDYF